MNDTPDALTPRDEERLADYMAGRLGAEERAAFEREILARRELAEAVYEGVAIGAMLDEAREDGVVSRAAAGAVADVVAIDPALERARDRAQMRAHGGRRWVRLALPIAAVLAIAILTPRVVRQLDGTARDDDGFRLRSSTRPGDGGGSGADAPRAVAPAPAPAPSRPRGLAPRGILTAPPERLLWTRDPAAAHYRVELYDASTQLIFSQATPETSFVLPEEAVPWDDVTSVAWRVVPLRATGEENPASEFVPFFIQAPSASRQPQ